MDKEDNWALRSKTILCHSCMYFVLKKVELDSDVTGHLGRCRRHAPTMNGYPLVFKTDWCGDHKLDEHH